MRKKIVLMLTAVAVASTMVASSVVPSVAGPAGHKPCKNIEKKENKQKCKKRLNQQEMPGDGSGEPTTVVSNDNGTPGTPELVTR